jgi:2-polyprenyl-3-methyl-5-hydroxy-6-metoxy-1,4-benzoquinol methylase
LNKLGTVSAASRDDLKTRLKRVLSRLGIGAEEPRLVSGLSPLRPDDVRAAYRIFLDREAESDEVVEEKANRLPDTAALRREFLLAPEFRQLNDGVSQPTMDGLESPMSVAYEPSPELMEALYEHVRSTWQRLGETDPHWSVSTSEVFRAGRIDESGEAFYASGAPDAARFAAACARAGLPRFGGESCLEFGCGVGRVTLWLSRHFKTVHAVDISGAHLAEAKSALLARGVSNVVFHELKEPSALGSLPEVDAVFTMAVLQHNPPPLIFAAIRALLGRLSPGGVATFQLPTWASGYSFETRAFLEQIAANPGGGMEMHVLPQTAVFRAVRESGCETLEVLEDGVPGPSFRGLSNTFLVRRPSA